jgi:hypothetical protein
VGLDTGISGFVWLGNGNRGVESVGKIAERLGDGFEGLELDGRMDSGAGKEVRGINNMLNFTSVDVRLVESSSSLEHVSLPLRWPLWHVADATTLLGATEA